MTACSLYLAGGSAMAGVFVGIAVFTFIFGNRR